MNATESYVSKTYRMARFCRSNSIDQNELRGNRALSAKQGKQNENLKSSNSMHYNKGNVL